MRRRATLLGVGVVVAMSLTACSKPGATTCSEYAKLSVSDRSDVVVKMVKDHDLDPYSNALGLASLEQDVDRFCGVSAFGSTTSAKNGSQGIEKGVQWGDYTY